jgi:hypothetical protein
MDFLQSLDSLQKGFWIIALISGLIFIVQSILTFIGSDSMDGINADFDGNLDSSEAPFQLFSFRNLINFLLGFSWSGVSFYSIIENRLLLISICFFVGVLFVVMFFLIIKQLGKLAEDNSFKFEETVNKNAEVYLSIPENKSGLGKILISVNGSFRQLDAMTENEKIETGNVVKVVRVENNSILIVEKFK